ncbi:MAG TPA: protein kinase [Archangium sp.]|uniref:serine/threonine protein kinase n=1 Tax=Archangium sp. TaxID=1872627 RepID=UPI002E35E1EB|nr:protein kinase [Archangium sp.]HEX5751451.1 protein kinase [Archangium sp.]
MSAPVGSAPGSCVACARPCAEPRCSFCGAARAPGGLRVQRVLSQSVHGRLYLALDAEGRSVAIKELVFAHAPDADKVEAFERESRLLQALSHPNIPRLHASFAEGEGAQARFYLVQDYVSGESLAARLEHHRFDEAEARKIAREVLRILGFLHSRQPPVLHRDVKPANLIRREDGHIVLVDFGSARALREGRTHEATLNGTFGYMAPEQLGGSVSPVSDLYALGASLLHLLSRRPPETLLSGDWELVFTREIHVSEQFRAFLRKLVARRPEDRFPSAADALLALDAPLPKTAPRWPLAAAGAALAVGVVAFVSAKREPAPAPAVVAAPRAPPKPVESSRPTESPEPPAQESPSGETPAGKVLAHWSFEDSGRALLFQSAERGPALKPLEVDLVPGARGRGVLLGGTGSLGVVREEGHPGFAIPSEGALSLWLSRERPGAGPVLTAYAGIQRTLQLRLDESGRLTFAVGPRELVSPQPLELGRFMYVALEWGATGMRLWVEGGRVAEDVEPVPEGGLGEGLRIGWDALVPGELAPAMALDEVRLRTGPVPSETWSREAGDLGRDGRVFSPSRTSSPEPVRPSRSHDTPSVELRLETPGDIDLSQHKQWLGSSSDCLRGARLALEGVEVVTGEKVHLLASFSFSTRTRCGLSLPLFLEDEEGGQSRNAHLLFQLERGGVEHARGEFTFSEGERYGVLGIGSRSAPLAKFRIDWETLGVRRVSPLERKD